MAPAETARSFDVFFAYASEDASELVSDLAAALNERHLKVWLDREQIHLGDELGEKIAEGLKQSRYGVVILSPGFFAGGWPGRDLQALMQREVGGEHVILPIWHRISEDQVHEFAPSIASKFAMSTDRKSIDEMADKRSPKLRVHLTPSDEGDRASLTAQ